MRALVVGAGASIEESFRSSRDKSIRFPGVLNFAQVLWAGEQPFPFLDRYLLSLGVTPGKNWDWPIKEFVALEKTGKTNVERFFEWSWQQRAAVSAADHDVAWRDLIYFSITLPILGRMIMCFFENGKDWVELQAGRAVAEKLKAGDLVVNLNYDVCFDIAVERSGKPYNFVPNSGGSATIRIAKPHGSLNIIVEPQKSGFFFCPPSKIGGGNHNEESSYSLSMFPPRLNKSHKEHPIADVIIRPLMSEKPDTLTFWGIGLTESDEDLNALYSQLAAKASKIEFINPDEKAKERAERVLGRPMRWFPTLDDWLKT